MRRNGALLKTISMRIDLYNNHEVFIKEQQQDWSVSKWLRGRGIKIQDLRQHPQIADVITIIRICDDLWHRMNSYEQAVLGRYWNTVYNKHYPVNKKFWNKIEQIVKAIDSRENIMAQQRQRIKALRQNPSNNTELHDKANRSVPAQSKLHEKGTTGVLLGVTK